MQSKKIIQNASWIIVCRVIQSLMSLIIGTISARYLGPSNYGLISYASAVVAFFVPIVQLGLRNVLVQEILERPDQEGETLGTALFMSVMASLVGIFGAICFVSIANRGETDTIIVCSLYSISLVFQMTEMIQYWYQAKLLSKYTSIASLIAYAIVSTYRIYLLITQKSVYAFALTNALDYFLISAILFSIYYRRGEQKLSVSRSLAGQLFARSKYYIVAGMMITIFSQTDRIMLKHMVGEDATGFYSAAITCASISSFVFGAIIDSLRPVILENKKNNSNMFEKNMIRLYAIIIYLGLTQSIALTFLAKYVVFLLYGSEYLATVSILQIVTWYTSFSYMGTVRNIWILAEKKQHILWIINLAGAFLNVIGNFLLIPLFGANGAALASVMTQFFANVILCFIIREIRRNAYLIIKSLNPKVLLELLSKIDL